MTKEALAALLDGREYRDEITSAEEDEANYSGLLVIFGASDDLCELRGALEEEIGCCDGGTIYLSRDGKIVHEIDQDDIEVLEKYDVYGHVQKMIQDSIAIEAVWDDGEYSWTYETDAPHASFDILEDGDKYCRGIVIDLKDLRKKGK